MFNKLCSYLAIIFVYQKGWSLNFKDPATDIMEGIVDFHHDIQFYLMVIVTFVAWMLFSIIYEFGLLYYFGLPFASVEKLFIARKGSLVTKTITHGTILEIVWTIVPAITLIAIAVPSFSLLYSIDEVIDPMLTIKVIGHQWYWSYEYSDFIESEILFDSYMIAEEDLELGELRLLEVDRKLWLPTYTYIRVLVTSVDVIHSWAIPSFGVKMDALPGRLNQVSLFIKREGIFYGQCSELCGVNHGFMPICVKAVPLNLFNFWVDYIIKEL
jgi:cytochrome c oxidase subunit 2